MEPIQQTTVIEGEETTLLEGIQHMRRERQQIKGSKEELKRKANDYQKSVIENQADNDYKEDHEQVMKGKKTLVEEIENMTRVRRGMKV